MKTLTVRHPWAALIAAGVKDIENRSRPTGYRGPLAIHASLTVDWKADIPTEAGRKALRQLGGLAQVWDARTPARGTGPAALATGAIIAVADLVGCHGSHAAGFGRHDQAVCYNRTAGVCSPYAIPGMAHWQLANVRPLPEPVVCRGSLGLWMLPDGIEAEVVGQLAAAPVSGGDLR
ncbi:MAG: ASCH domain-containing protein [Microbispora sp.]|nr:ASCH domain-containing protein [Microbispora sp.]